MDIPKIIKQAVILREQQMREAQLKAREARERRTQCWKRLGEMSKFHDHDENGRCIERNWSNEDAKGNWRKSK